MEQHFEDCASNTDMYKYIPEMKLFKKDENKLNFNLVLEPFEDEKANS